MYGLLIKLCAHFVCAAINTRLSFSNVLASRLKINERIYGMVVYVGWLLKFGNT
jgi:hypothetical protein